MLSANPHATLNNPAVIANMARNNRLKLALARLATIQGELDALHSEYRDVLDDIPDLMAPAVNRRARRARL